MSVFMTQDDFAAIALVDGVREVALGDAWLRFADYKGSVREFLKEIKPECPHYWAAPAADTPDNAALYSVKAQGDYVREHGEAAARSMLASEGLTLGKIRSAPKPDHSGSNNPYGLPASDPKRMEKIIALISSANPNSARLAASLAASAGCRIDGTKIPKQ